jgi:hypothetical protein
MPKQVVDRMVHILKDAHKALVRAPASKSTTALIRAIEGELADHGARESQRRAGLPVDWSPGIGCVG